MNAIVVLTRGYNTVHEYNKLIRRNKEIEKYFTTLTKNIPDFVLFHEGNISIEHEKHIQKQTPCIKLIFVNVSKSFQKKKYDFYPPTEGFTIGYRNMCNFWFCDFWKYTNQYEKIVRIDEDCFMKSSPMDILDKLDEYSVVYGYNSKDSERVTKGLNDFTLTFLQERNVDAKKESPSGPYTNVLGLNLSILRSNTILEEYRERVFQSNNIFIYRWGDLPLWGEVIKYMLESNQSLLYSSISYYHESHKIHIAEGDFIP